jgi:S-adenosylmethionine/arginine decarboxylase-like enzyme
VQGEPWLHYAGSLAFLVELGWRMRLIPPAKASKDVGRKLAHARDVGAHIREAGRRLAGGSPVSGLEELTAAATAAVGAGDGRVLDTSHVIFPNGAVTLVLIVAGSDLAVCTWSEEDLAAVDLFACGAIDADRVVAELITGLRLADTRVQQVRRAPRAAERPCGPYRLGSVTEGMRNGHLVEARGWLPLARIPPGGGRRES